MTILKLPLRTVLFTVLGAMISTTHLPALASTPEPSGLFLAPEDGAKARQAQRVRKGKYRDVRINKDKLRKGRVFIKLPDGTSFEAVREQQQERGKGRFAWVGHASDDPGDRVVLGISGNAVAGTFAYKGKLFRLEPRADGSHVVSEASPADPAPELDPIPVADTAAASATSADTRTAADGNGSVIDVLVAYTPAVKALYGTAGAEAMILQAISEANQAYANSAMTTRLNLVRSVLTNYTESGDINSDLSRLRATSDGFMDELHTLRDQVGADVVSLIENEPDYCGLAYRMTTLSAGFASNAFNVVHHGCATGYYSLAHEIGHNQGAHHDYANTSGGAIYPYAYGYQDTGNAFRTVMAYNCPGGCTRISYFSNPQVYYNGKLTGSAGSADNARTIDATAATVAAFRGTALQLIPAAPANLGSTTLGPNAIDVSWQDKSTNESGFLLERSLDGTNFSQIASLAANTTIFHDEALTPDTLYQYRVRAWNSAGNSPYSNLTVAATEDEPEYYDQFVFVEGVAAGTVTGTYLDTQADDAIKESIKEVLSTGTGSYSYLEHYWVIKVAAGDKVTLYADVSTTSSSQSFTFAYSTVPGTLADKNVKWVDMFTVTSSTPGSQQFELPSTISGNVYISVRDNKRVAGSTRQDTVKVDYLAIRTLGGSGPAPESSTPPPGC